MDATQSVVGALLCCSRKRQTRTKAKGPLPCRARICSRRGALSFQPPGLQFACRGTFPAVANVNLVHLFDPKRLDVLSCDMCSGEVSALRPYEADPTWRVMGDGRLQLVTGNHYITNPPPKADAITIWQNVTPANGKNGCPFTLMRIGLLYTNSNGDRRKKREKKGTRTGEKRTHTQLKFVSNSS
jgi:hypothetical protein